MAGTNASGTVSSRDGKRLIHAFTFGPRLQIAASPSVEVGQGGQNRVNVRIARTRFTGPVSVALAEPSAGVTIATNATSFKEGSRKAAGGTPSSDWRELVQTHDDWAIFQASAKERLVIDIHSL